MPTTSPETDPAFEPADLLAALVLGDGRLWGEAVEPEQWADALAILDPNSTTPYHFITRGRGWSKTTDQAAAVIPVMLTQAPPGSKIYALASDRDQAALVVDAFRGFVTRTPLIHNAFVIDRYKVTAPGTNVTLEVLASDAPGAYGLQPYFVIVDELAQWRSTPGAKEPLHIVVTALPKVADSRLVVITSAGDPAH